VSTPDAGALREPPLAGVRVADFSQGAAGGLCGAMLRDLGAEVIKCEPPWGEWSRQLAPRRGDTSAVFSALNGGKRSARIDLRDEADAALARALCLASDVVMESMRPGKMAAAGLDYASLSGAKPALVYCSISGFGQDGPWRDRPAVDIIGQAAGGLLSLTRAADGEVVRAPLAADFTCGMLAAYGAVAALLRARSTGEGDHVDASLMHAAMGYGRVALAAAMFSEGAARRAGSDAGYAAPNGVFGARDGDVAIAANMPRKWAAFCEALGADVLLADERFTSEDLRVRHARELRAAIEDLLGERDADDVVAALADAEVPVARVLGIAEACATDQGRLQGRVATTSRAGRPDVAHLGAAPRLRHTRAIAVSAEPALGADDDEVRRIAGIPAPDDAAAAAAAIEASRCPTCDDVAMPPVHRCPACQSGARCEPIALSGRGRVEQSTVLHTTTGDFEAPYVVGFVGLDEGVRLYARLELPPGVPTDVVAGTPVRLVARADGGVRCVVDGGGDA
jgi:CoA:oxalate CoA-transferase